MTRQLEFDVALVLIIVVAGFVALRWPQRRYPRWVTVILRGMAIVILSMAITDMLLSYH